MSVLTKVFVVLLTVFSIALSMLVVGAFARQEDWKTSASHWQEVALAEQAKARTLAANMAIVQQQNLDQHRRDTEEINKLKDELINKDGQLSEKERALTEAENKLASEQGQVTSIGSTLQVVSASLDSERDFAKKLATRNSELERRNVDLNDRVKELTTSVAMAASQVRALQQQIMAIEENQTASAQGLRPATQIPGGPGIVEAGVPSVMPSAVSSVTAPIRGQVTRVSGSLASLSVGSSDGVAPGMTFLVYRRNASTGRPQYLGTVKVTTVNANESAGEIQQSDGDIQPGDAARDEASFAMRH